MPTLLVATAGHLNERRNAIPGAKEISKDQTRTAFIEKLGYCVLRFTNEEVYEQLDRLCEAILLALDRR